MSTQSDADRIAALEAECKAMKEELSSLAPTYCAVMCAHRNGQSFHSFRCDRLKEVLFSTPLTAKLVEVGHAQRNVIRWAKSIVRLPGHNLEYIQENSVCTCPLCKALAHLEEVTNK